ncbi:MAG: hypothetical protein L3J51_05035 [Cocleimonas sp.]|nr:hypothetical protein [Cocleimonas sp.]
MKNITYLTINVQHCMLEVAINDIVLVREDVGSKTLISTPIHEYLINGDNELKVNIKSNDENHISPHVIVRVANYIEGSFLTADEGVTLAEIECNPKEENYLFNQKYLHKENFIFSLNTKRWAWELAKPLKLSESLVAKANKFVQNIKSDLNSLNTVEISASYQTLFKEKAACYPMISVEQRKDDLMYLLTVMREGGFQFIEINPKMINYRVSANGKLLECIDRNGLPLLRTSEEKIESIPGKFNYADISMHIGLINNEFRLLR